jgi:hypothetical protein
MKERGNPPLGGWPTLLTGRHRHEQWVPRSRAFGEGGHHDRRKNWVLQARNLRHLVPKRNLSPTHVYLHRAGIA